MKKLLMSTLIFSLFFSTTLAQVTKETETTGKTKLEQFSAKTGVVLVQGFQEIGIVKGLHLTSVRVVVREFTNVNDGSKQYGVMIEPFEGGRYDKKHASYVDYDEIESLIKGIEYILKMDSSVSQLTNFQANYSTRGDLTVGTFSSDGKVLSSISSGTIAEAKAFLNLEDLEKMKALLEQAKAKLDEIKS